ncbi:acyl-CoA dehydrogenase family protein [Sphingomonas colocasiae]|uniref:Acyl-CoA dehydrogenase family protein n=1 Tax=Sphingomonas colocasiae TaxID=1848973 RepID=A0ABS7PHS0_9SPHN|nr:acyl-CoA dehydrogenase family protein [Sphingomonas colocasiae]MBY8820846.1 acyl-CoA dehydrogenase family protein [Sphingomonas colocasiae]
MPPLARTEEQRMLQHAVAQYLAARRPADMDTLWRGLSADLGLMGTGIAEDRGGHGGGDIEITIVMAELGRALTDQTWLETMVAARLLARTTETSPRLDAMIAAIVAGDARFALLLPGAAAITSRATADGWVIDGGQCLVVGGATATHLIVAAETGARCPMLLLIDADAHGASRSVRRMIDGSMTADIGFSATPLSADALIAVEDEATMLVDWATDALLAGRSAEIGGILARMLEETTAFMRERRQFGKPIGTFQTLRHRLVDMHIEAAKAQALTIAATDALGHAGGARARMASAARVQAGLAARCVGEGAVQIHGAMGLTDELPLGRSFKRARYLASLGGNMDDHLARHALANAA